MAKSHSQKLRVLAEQGHKIVCAVGIFQGTPVEFAPTYPPSADGTGQTDRKPWVIRSEKKIDPETGAYEVLVRLSGAECRVAKEGE